MKNLVLILVVFILSLKVTAQQKDFEGVLEYRVQVKSKVEGISDKVMKVLLATEDRMTVYMKEGNYLLSSPVCDQYYVPKKQRVYMKFKAIDTLYYLDYADDTSSLLNVSKTNEEKTIAGQKCNSIIVQISDVTKKYFYAPALYVNPVYDKNNKIGRYDIYTKETSSVWLAEYDESPKYSLSYDCVKIEAKKNDESIFELPKLPEKKFSVETITKPPEFTRSGGWIKYLTSSVDKEVAAKYVKVPKGEQVGTVTVLVRFLINEFGRVTNVEAVNKKDVHPKLAEEAVRIVSASPIWSPSTIYGQKTIYWYQQPITFQAAK